MLLSLFVHAHPLGLSMRAAAEDLDAARLMGININRVVASAFAIGSGPGGGGGLLFAVQAGQVNPYMGFSPVLKAFIAAVIGGFGSIAGAGCWAAMRSARSRCCSRRCRALAISCRPAWSRPAHRPPCGSGASSLAGYRDAFVFVALILMLLFRPNGLLGKRSRDEL